MHFAYPPRKNSNPPPYAPKSSRSPFLRNDRLRTIALVAAGILALLYIFSRGSGGSSLPRAPAGTPPVVIVTTIDPDRSEILSSKVQANRRQYAEIHGYAAFTPSKSDYNVGGSPKSWSKVPAIRHAMTVYPHSTYFFYLDENTVISNLDIDVEVNIMAKRRLESLMMMDQPVIPPDSVIKTFAHLKGDRIDLVLTQDREGLAHNSFIVRRGEWAKYFLDAWFDPLYRSYNFQKADQHALEHLVQWHGTILAKLALIPQSIMNSYSDAIRGDASEAGGAREGDFITHFGPCDNAPRDCLAEMEPYLDKASRQYESLR